MLRTSATAVTAVIIVNYCIAVAAFSATAESDGQIHEAAGRSVRLIEQTSARFLEASNCFACHTQTLSIMVLTDAADVGFGVDEQNLKRQVERVSEVYDSLHGVRVDTVGYGLWALDIARQAPDNKTEEMVDYLLQYERQLGHWEVTVDRPPAEASDFTTNFVAIRGLKRYGAPRQQQEITARKRAVHEWLQTATVTDTEDQVFRLRLGHELGIDSSEINVFVQKLLAEQHSNGGWAQKLEMEADPYATGSVLVALRQTVGLGRDNPNWHRGIHYLLKTQNPDGSWHVRTRAKPIQEHFESGFPHGKDQFISAFATAWATEALLLALRNEP